MPLIKIGVSTYNDAQTPVYLLQGNATRDAEDKPVNGKDHCVVGVAAAEDKFGGPIYVNINGWRQMSGAVRAIVKGDSVLAIGRLKVREYNGRKYYDLDADFLCRSGAGLLGAADVGELPHFSPAGGGVPVSAEGFDDGLSELPDDGDGELPF